MTANPEDVSYILQNPEHFTRATAEIAVFNDCQPIASSKITHEERRSHRSRIRTSLSSKMLPQMANGVAQTANGLIADIDEYLVENPDHIFNFTPMLADALFSSFMKNVMGIEISREERGQFIRDASDFLMELVIEYFSYPLRRLFAFLGVRKRLVEKTYRVRKFASDVLNRRKKEMRELGRSRFSLIDMVLDMHNDNVVHQVTTATTMCISSYETTSEGLAWALYEVSKDKRVEMKLVAEVDDFFSRKDEVEYEDLGHFKYLSQVWKETIRLHPASGLMFRRVEKDVKLPGSRVVVQKNCKIGVLISSAQRNGKYVGRPDDFLPERWGPEAKESERLPGYAFLSFSSGPERCPGQAFANFVSVMLLAYLYRTYSISLGCKKEEVVQWSDWVERARSPSPDKGGKDLSWTLPVSLRRRVIRQIVCVKDKTAL